MQGIFRELYRIMCTQTVTQTRCSRLRLLLVLSLHLFLPKHFIPGILLSLKKGEWDLISFIRHCWCYFHTSRNPFFFPKPTTSHRLVSKDMGASLSFAGLPEHHSPSVRKSPVFPKLQPFLSLSLDSQ